MKTTEFVRPVLVVRSEALSWTRMLLPDINVIVPNGTAKQAHDWYDTVRLVPYLSDEDVLRLHTAVNGAVEVRCGSQIITIDVY